MSRRETICSRLGVGAAADGKFDVVGPVRGPDARPEDCGRRTEQAHKPKSTPNIAERSLRTVRSRDGRCIGYVMLRRTGAGYVVMDEHFNGVEEAHSEGVAQIRLVQLDYSQPRSVRRR